MPGERNGVQHNGMPASPERRVFDPEDPAYVKDLQRPAVIKEDLNEMERRKRVRQVLESQPFREELEALVTHERGAGNDPQLQSLDKLCDMILPPAGQMAAASLHGISSQAIAAIADMRGADAGRYSKSERILRNKLAALFRLVDLFQWSQGIYNHITLRVGAADAGTAESEQLLVNPFGLLYHEIGASSLLKMDLQGELVDGGSSGLGLNDAAVTIHTAIHRARPDVRCVLHLHTPVVGAVSAMKCGLLPLCQEAMIVGPVSYHDFHGIANDPSEMGSIAEDLGPTNKVMLLRNHGLLACASTVEEALHLTFNVVLACETQVMFLQGNGFVVCTESVEEAALLTRSLILACDQQIRASRAGLENLVLPSEEAQQRCRETALAGGGGVMRSPDKTSGRIQWRVGELEWEAWMRVLDNAGFRSGHLYRQPMLRQKMAATAAAQSDVEVPPAASSFGLLDETDAGAMAAHREAALRREKERGRWLNSPNAYQRVEMFEEGTDNPKKFTKWVSDESGDQHSTAVKISDTHQFTPVPPAVVNSKEFKNKQKEIKEARRSGGISAGPRSHVLEAVNYEDAQAVKDAQMSGTQDGLMLIGTASKGIIERDFQHNAQVYRQLYAPNPFASETDEDIQKYMKEVEQKKPLNESFSNPISDAATDSPSADTASLMQAAREHRRHVAVAAHENPIAEARPPGYTHETTFDERNSSAVTKVVDRRSTPQPSSINGNFGRSKSERPGKKHANDSTAASDTRAASDDDLNESKDSKKEKKKKKSFFSFGKKDKKKTKELETGV